MKKLNMIKVYEKYKGLWVVFDGPHSDKVIASGKDLRKAVEEAKEKGVKIPAIAQIPKKILPIVGPLSFR